MSKINSGLLFRIKNENDAKVEKSVLLLCMVNALLDYGNVQYWMYTIKIEDACCML